MTSRRIAITIICALFALFVANGAALAEKPMNVVVILVDDLGYMDIGAYNPKTFYETPNVDRLAKSGLRFTDGYAANPVCSPTRFSMMTGRHPSRIDATNFFSGRRPGKFLPAPLFDRMPIDEVTVADAVKTKGYATFFAGKWHLGPTAEFWPKKQGFDINKGGHNRGGPYGGKKYFSPYGNPRLEDGPPGEHLPIRLANDTAKFIEDNKDGNFLAYLSFYSVHTPLIGRKDLVEKYKKRAEKIAGEEFGPEEQNLPSKRARRVRILQKHAVYAAMMEAMDEGVGIVLDKLEKLGLDKNTAVFFTSDNGGLSTSEGHPTSNLPLRAGKGWCYEGGIRVPFIARIPGATKAGTTSAVPVMTTDFFPTILELAGIARDPKATIDGKSLVPLIRRKAASHHDALYWHYPHYSNQGGFPGGAIRVGDWKLLERYEDGRVELYNLTADIGEQKNVAGEHADRVQSMRSKLHAWYKDVDAKFLRPKKGQKEKPWRP